MNDMNGERTFADALRQIIAEGKARFSAAPQQVTSQMRNDPFGFVPPHWQEALGRAAGLLEFTDAGDAKALYDTSRAAGDALSRGDYKTAALNVPGMAASAASMALPFFGVGGAIKAYHGSPYDFDKFDLSKIGTGEGAQAYGHGLYFAENESVARAYRDNLGTYRAVSKLSSGPTNRPGTVARMFAGDVDEKSIREAMLALEPDAPGEQIDAWVKEGRRLYNATADKSGRMYEVNIHADPEKFLDWDKPLSQQTPQTRSALRKLGYDVDQNKINEFNDALLSALTENGPTDLPRQPIDLIGADIYQSAAYGRKPIGFDNQGKAIYDAMAAINGRNPVSASTRLNEAGIPGIKYLDQGSRAAGEGSRNYVVFDPRIIEILRKWAIAAPISATAYSLANYAEQSDQEPIY